MTAQMLQSSETFSEGGSSVQNGGAGHLRTCPSRAWRGYSSVMPPGAHAELRPELR